MTQTESPTSIAAAWCHRAKHGDGRRLFSSKMTVWREEGLKCPQKTRQLFPLGRQTDTRTPLGPRPSFLLGSSQEKKDAAPVGLGRPKLQLGINTGNDARCCLREPEVADGWAEPILVALGLQGLRTWFAPDNPAVILVKRRQI